VRQAPAVTAPLEAPGESTPPRARWLRRLLLGVVLLWVLLVATWVVLLALASHELDLQRRAARARHEPVDAADFAGPPLAKEDNAVTHLLRACEQYHPNDGETAENWDALHTSPLTPEAARILRPYIAANAKALAEIRSLRRCPGADWHLLDPAASPREREQRYFDYFLSLNRTREVDLLLSSACAVAHQDGDDAAAVEYLRDLLAATRAIDSAPALVGHLISMGSDALAAQAVTEVVASLNASAAAPSATSSPITRRPAGRAQVAGLVDQFLNEPQRRERASRAFLGDRARVLSLAGEPTLELVPPSGGAGEWTTAPMPRYRRALDLLRRPMLRHRAAAEAGTLGQAAAAVRRLDWPSAAALAPAFRRRNASTVPLVRWLSGEFGSNYGLSVNTHFRATAERRMAAVLLALRLYQLDHAGQFPATLQQLAGAYLPSVPADPFAKGGRPIGYLRCGQTVFVYSVFEDGVDDIAAGWLPTAADHDRWDRPDYDLMFDRRAPLTPASAPAATAPTSRSGRSRSGRSRSGRSLCSSLGRSGRRRRRASPLQARCPRPRGCLTTPSASRS
jgi:hypothetical protein